MDRRLLPTAFALLSSASALACSGSSSSPSGDPGAPSIAESSLSRDPASSISPQSLQDAVTANNAFAFDLYGRLASQNAGQNLITSPLSASIALTMTYAGAQGSTASQMATALHLGSSASTIFDGQNALAQALAQRAASALAADQQNATGDEGPAPSADDYQLQVVNSLWGEKAYSWQQPFLDTLAKSYGAGMFLEDFENAPDAALQAINSWVSGETSGKIANLLPPQSVDSSTRFVLVNAIHLKLPWATPFNPADTAPGSFTRADGSTVSASFMTQSQEWSYTDDGNAQIVALPLSTNDEVWVVIALPHGDLASYEAMLAAGSAAIAVPPGSTEVSLSLPKVSFTSVSFSLSTQLQTMGMTDAFNPNLANFTGMYAGGNLYVSDVLQKAMIDMQETGVEAAAATAVIGATAGIVWPPVTLTVNRPYLVSIVDQPTGAVLFLGHIVDPTATGGS